MSDTSLELLPSKKSRRTRSQQSTISTVLSVEIPKKGKGKAKAIDTAPGSYKRKSRNKVPKEDEENEEKRVDELISERTKRAWETRRARAVPAITEDGVSRVDENGAGPSSSPLQTPLPTSELLLSIHRHASQFYTNNGLLFQSEKKARQKPWGSKKRVLIVQDATTLHPNSDSNTAPSRKSKSKSQSQSQSTELFEEGEIADELDPVQIKQEGLVDDYGELIFNRDRDQGSEYTEKRDRSKGKYKKRDLYRAIEGEGLMALGVLLQEHIISSIHAAGYRPKNHSQVENHIPRQNVRIPPNNGPKSPSLEYESEEGGSERSKDSFFRHQMQ
ncbi:uncharacterized protein IL334_000198 [Kwoniella shivajii]|uniref:Ribosome biogenesis protein SLX9 n=1 Tax=Kwoniella shivajii TaxID=564305 RepID=A0ABZ1CNH4_9TREE|nr:hypothetical protein IL334_000198 [Kwoniella shivajii]